MTTTKSKTETFSSAAPPKISKIAAASLVPDLSKFAKDGTSATEYLYWCGLDPKAPVEYVNIAGLTFPKASELIVDDPLRTSTRKRIPVIGQLERVSLQAMTRLRDLLPRTVVRFYNSKEEREEPGTGKNVGDIHQRPSRGQLITIPTAEAIARGVQPYIPSKNDVPIARLIFMQLCADQVRGSRGEFYPDPVEVTGIDWPE
jgi:hypothetical protein